MADKRVEYTIGVKNEGLENLTRIIDELDKAGVETSEFKKQAELLRQQLAETARQQSLIDSFVKIKQEVGAAGTAMETAQAKAQQLGRELAATDAPTKKQTAEFGRARDAVNSTKDAYQAAQVRLQAMRGTLAENNIETTSLAQKQAALRTGVRDVDAAVAGATTRLKDLGSAGPKAVNDTAKATDQAATSAKGYEGALTQVAKAVTGAFAVTRLAGFAKSTIEVADAYGQMAERVKMATSSQDEFDLVQQRLLASANITYRALSEQQELYIRTSDALRSMAYSTEQVLDITDSFTYLLTTNAASVEKGKNAIDAYTKSIQSGKVEVDSWQSIMAATPTIVDAIAKSTGKTTEEVRKLGITGALSVKDLNEGLRQTVAINKEAAEGMSATVNDALTRLTNTWSAYIGEANKAGGQTKEIVQLIDKLSGNLDTLVATLQTAGKFWAAMKIASLSADFGAWALKTMAATTAIESNTAAVASNTVAQRGNSSALAANAVAQAASTAAVGAGTVAKKANAASWSSIATFTGQATKATQSATSAMAAGGSAIASKTVQVGFLRVALRGILSVLGGPIGLVANLVLFSGEIKRGASAVGEWVMGFTEAGQSLQRYEKEQKAAEEVTRQSNAAIKAQQESIKLQAQALKEAADRSFDLGKAGAELVTKFDDMRTKGDSAAKAIESIGKDFDLTNVPGIQAAASVLDKLAADGKISATEFQKAWADALKGEDLAIFETRAIAAFKGTAREAERMAQIMDASLRESIRRTGLDFDLISGGMGKASRNVINDTEAMIKGLDRLKAMGVDTAQALTASIGKSINTAESQKALDAVKSQIEAVRKVLGDKIADGLLDQAKQKSLELSDALDKAKPGINSLREAMSELGLKSRDELELTAKKAQEAFAVITQAGQAEGESFEVWQKRKTAAAEVMLTRMIEANQGVATETIKSRAAMEGLEVQTNATGKSIIKAMDGGKKATDDMTQSFAQSTEQVKKYEEAMDKMLMKYKLSADYSENQLAILEKENALLERREALENKRLNRDKEGFSLDTGGKRVNMAIDTQASTYSNAKSQGLSEEQALKIAAQFINERGEKMGWQGGGFGGMNQGQTWGSELQKAIDKIKLENAATAAQAANAGNTQAPAAPINAPERTLPPATGSTNQAVWTRNVNISVNNMSMGNVPTNETGDATLERMMRKLYMARGASSIK